MVTGVDKDFGFSGLGMKRINLIWFGAGFKNAGAGGADCDNAFALFFSLVEMFGCGCRKRKIFRVHGVVFNVWGFYWREGAESYVESNKFILDSLVGDFF